MFSCPKSVQEKIETLVGKEVSRETFLGLEVYFSLLLEENKKYNLVGPQEMDRFWERHVLDSAQLVPFLKDASSFLDIGSGGGFPGVVLSLLGVSGGVLVESSSKKSSFLGTVSRETGVAFSVLNDRVENLRGLSFQYIVSRAVASVERLLLWSKRVSSQETLYFFLKGKSFQEEIVQAKKHFSFDVSVFPSASSNEGRVLKIKNISW